MRCVRRERIGERGRWGGLISERRVPGESTTVENRLGWKEARATGVSVDDLLEQRGNTAAANEGKTDRPGDIESQVPAKSEGNSGIIGLQA